MAIVLVSEIWTPRHREKNDTRQKSKEQRVVEMVNIDIKKLLYY